MTGWASCSKLCLCERTWLVVMSIARAEDLTKSDKKHLLLSSLVILYLTYDTIYHILGLVIVHASCKYIKQAHVKTTLRCLSPSDIDMGWSLAFLSKLRKNSSFYLQ